MKNREKLQWIKKTGQPYVVLWVKVSRVADFYHSYFNHWMPRDGTDHIDAAYRLPPDPLWEKYSQSVFEALIQQGFLLAPHELLGKKVESVMAWGGNEIPDSDPRWDEDNFEPPPVPATVYQCLFGDV